MPKNTISACIVTHNDEHQIERCLKSINDVVDEIIVVHDGPCTDKTLEIAKKYTDRVFVGKSTGNPEPHRITTFEKASGEWILVIDPDEFLSKELHSNLRRLVDSGKADGYMFLWKFWDGTKYITKNWPHRIGVVKKSSLHFLAILHPDWTIKGTSLDVPYHLEHQPNYNNCNWQCFRTKWTKWLKRHAVQVIMPIEEIPKFQYTKDTKPKHIEWIRKYSVFSAPFVFAYFFAGAIKLSFPTERFTLTKYAFFQALYYTLLSLEVFKLQLKSLPLKIFSKPQLKH